MTEFLVKYQNAIGELGGSFDKPSMVTPLYNKIQKIVDPNTGLTPPVIQSSLEPIIQNAIDRAGSIYNDPIKCPSTSGSTVQPARGGTGGVNTKLSTPTNL